MNTEKGESYLKIDSRPHINSRSGRIDNNEKRLCDDHPQLDWPVHERVQQYSHRARSVA